MTIYYDRDGKPIFSSLAFGKLFADKSYQIIVQYEDERIFISTVWIGMDLNFSGSPDTRPLIFETMTFVREGSDIPGKFNELRYRWRTEAEAREGHNTLVCCYHEGIEPEAPMDEVRKKHSQSLTGQQ